MMTLRITGRREDEKGANTHYRLSNAQIVARIDAVSMQRRGMLPDYEVITVNGKEYLRDKSDKNPRDNIDNQQRI